MKKKSVPFFESAILLIGELIVSLLLIGIWLICDLIFESELFDFSYRVITGVSLGTAVTVINYVFMNVSVNRAVDRFLTLRGTGEMNDEEAAQFAAENSAPIQNAIKTSFIIRTVSMLVTLVGAFVLDAFFGCFSPIATAVPLLAFRPIITVGELARRKYYAKKASAFTAPIETSGVDITDEDSEEVKALKELVAKLQAQVAESQSSADSAQSTDNMQETENIPQESENENTKKEESDG